MLFTPEVVAALQTLRDNATNDFERHRLDVLERDLSAPPTVEVIDDTHQRFNGITYRQMKDKHFAASPKLHRVVWQYYNGTIPAGYHIHHVDGKPANNGADNLQCLSREEHARLHSIQDGKIPPRPSPATKVCIHCGKEFTVGERPDNNGYCSSSCRIAHLYRLEENQTAHICERCGKEFIAYKYSTARFCSDACRYADVQTVKKICPVCGKEFNQPTWRNNSCCSHSCSSKLMWQTKRASDRKETRQCLYCGQNFPVNKPTQQFCSKSCVMKYRYRKN